MKELNAVMNPWGFVEGPLLWIAFITFITGILARGAFFVFGTLKRSRIDYRHFRWKYILATFGRSLLPFHKTATRKPIYTTLRYIFHICLFVIPIWLSGHIIMWEVSRFGWHWTALPNEWADWMTILFLGLAAYFLIRRIRVKNTRFNSSKADYFLIVMTALPFITGYLQTHGTLDAISFLGDNMLGIHMLSGEAMLIGAVFLFYKTRLSGEKCVGCGACAVACPTGTLEPKDEGNFRIFNYSHYQCICCGACLNACPEEAAELRHEISMKRVFQVFSKNDIRTIELAVCEKCGAPYMPLPQLEQTERILAEKGIELLELKYCDNCTRRLAGTDISSPTFFENRVQKLHDSSSPGT